MLRTINRLILGLGLASTLLLPMYGQDPDNPGYPPGPNPPPKYPDCEDCKGGPSDGGGTRSGDCNNASHGAKAGSVVFSMDVGRANFEPETDYIKVATNTGSSQHLAIDEARRIDIDETFDLYRDKPLSSQRQFKIWYENKQLAAEGISGGQLAVDEESQAELVRVYSAGPPRQVINLDCFIDIIELNAVVKAQLPFDLQAMLSGAGQGGFVIRVWNAEEKGALQTTGLYGLPTTEPLRYVVFYNPNGTNQGRMNIVHRAKYNSTQYKTLSYCYYEDATSHDWTMTTHDGLPSTQVIEETTLDVTSWMTALNIASAQTRTVKRVDLDASGAYGTTLKTISVTYEKFSVFGGKQRLVEETRGSGAEARTTKYLYYDSLPEMMALGDGRLKGIIYPDGNYVYMGYASTGVSNLTFDKIVSNGGTWDGSGVPGGLAQKHISARAIGTVGGIDVVSSDVTEESYHGTQLVGKTAKSWTYDTNGDKKYTEYKAVQPNGFGGFHTNGFEECFYVDGADALRKGKIKWRKNEDGTFETYAYQSIGGSTLHHTRTVAKGAGNVTLGVTSGKRIVTEINRWGYAVKEETYHFHGSTSVLLESWVSESEDFFGRPIKRVWNLAKNGHSNDYDETTYGCCGISSFRDRNGIVTQYYRDGMKREYRRVETAGSKTVTTSTAYVGRQTTVRSSATNGATTIDLLVSSTLYRENGELQTVSTPDQNGDAVPEVTSYTYSYPSEGGKIQTITYPDGGTEIQEYFPDGRVKKITGTAVAHREFAQDHHDINGGGLYNKTTYPTTVFPAGHWEKDYYDLSGRLFKIEYSTNVNSTLVNDFSTISYHGYGPLVHQRTDADGVTVVYTYDGEGNLATVTEPMPSPAGSRVTSYSHQGVNDPQFGGSIQTTTTINTIVVSVGTESGDGYSSRTESLGRTTTKIRSLGSGAGWSIKTTHPDGTYSLESYANGQLSVSGNYETSNTLIESTGFGYDIIGRLTSSTHSRKGFTIYGGYTESGLLGYVTDPQNRTTTTSYDAMGRVLETNAPDSLNAAGATIPNVTKTSYTKMGMVESVWGDQTYPTFRSYDEQGRMSQLRTYRAISSSTQPSLSEPNADLTTWNYHANSGLLAFKTDNANKGASYTYTAAGRLKTRTWARGAHTRYDYSAGKVQWVRYFTTPASNTGSNVGNDADTPDLGYTHDAFGRITNVTRGGVSHFTYGYDPTKLYLATETQNDAPVVQRLLTHKRDSLLRSGGYMLGTSADPDAISEVTNAYDTAGRLDSVTYKRVPGAATPPAAQTFLYDYEPNSYGLVKTVTGPKLATQNTWESHRDLLSVKENDAGVTQVSDYYYELNALGQRTAAEIHSGAGGLLTWEWGYDSKGQVVKADGSSGGGTADDRFYDYDQIGNRKQSRNGTFTSTGGSATDYFADTAATIVGASGLNQYKGIKTGGVTRNPVYDDDGNLTDDGTAWQYKWDGENRMIKATPKAPGVKIGYRYDYLGRLSARMTYTWGDLQLGTFRYAYNGWNRIEYVNSSLIREEYVWGLDLSGSEQGAGGVGGMLLWARTVDTGANWSIFYPAYDGNGNVTELVDSSGTVAAHWEYDPFGNTTKQVPASSTWSDPVVQFPYRFSTKWQDGNTGLYYYGYRFYDPVAGRWIAKDPIEERGGFNLYGFTANNGIGAVDILGAQGVLLTPQYMVRPVLQSVARQELRPYIPPSNIIPFPRPTPVVRPYLPPILPPVTIVPSPQPDSNPSTNDYPTPGPSNGDVNWDKVIDWMDEPDSQTKRNDRANKVSRCSQLHNKYKHAQDDYSKNPYGKANCCAELEKALIQTNHEISGRKQYIEEDCDEVPWGEGADHQGQLDATIKRRQNIIDKLRKKKCFENGTNPYSPFSGPVNTNA